MLNDERRYTVEGRTSLSKSDREGSCKTQLHADVNKALGFNYMNLLSCQILDNRVPGRTGLLRGKTYRAV